MPSPLPAASAAHRQRWMLLRRLDKLTDRPLLVLSFVWLILLVVDLTSGLSRPLVWLHYAIWGAFIADFAIEFTIAPRRLVYLRRHWLTAVSLLLPALRVLRVFQSLRLLRLLRAGRTVRSVTLLRLLTSLNRGVRATSRSLARRGVGYVAALTLLVLFGGAAGMIHFESPTALRAAGYAPLADQGLGLKSYGEALWWTAMILTTMGSEYWPKTGEGRVLCALLAVYAFAIFGYLTAAIASYLVGREPAVTAGDVEATLPTQIARLREQVAALAQQRGRAG